jgi:hypothetical protein
VPATSAHLAQGHDQVNVIDGGPGHGPILAGTRPHHGRQLVVPAHQGPGPPCNGRRARSDWWGRADLVAPTRSYHVSQPTQVCTSRM